MPIGRDDVNKNGVDLDADLSESGRDAQRKEVEIFEDTENEKIGAHRDRKAEFCGVGIVVSPGRLNEQAGQKVDRRRYKDQAEKSPIPPSIEYETASKDDHLRISPRW